MNFKINSRPLFTIIFKLKNDNVKTRDFSPLIERVLAGVKYVQTSKLNLIKTTISSSKLSTSATRKTTTTKKPTTTTKLPPLFDGILQPPILEGKNASKLTLSEPKLKHLRRGIVSCFFCHSHSDLYNVCPVPLDITKR